MVMQEELKILPFGEYSRQYNVPVDREWYVSVKNYEKKVLEVRK